MQNTIEISLLFEIMLIFLVLWCIIDHSGKNCMTSEALLNLIDDIACKKAEYQHIELKAARIVRAKNYKNITVENDVLNGDTD